MLHIESKTYIITPHCLMILLYNKYVNHKKI